MTEHTMCDMIYLANQYQTQRQLTHRNKLGRAQVQDGLTVASNSDSD